MVYEELCQIMTPYFVLKYCEIKLPAKLRVASPGGSVDLENLEKAKMRLLASLL